MVSFTKSTLLVTDAICGTVDEIEQLAACFDVLHDGQASLSMGDAEALPCLLTHPTFTIAPTIASFEAALTLLTNPAGFDGQMLIPDGVGGYCRLARGDAQRLLSDIETPFVIVVGPKRRFALVALRSAVELDVEDTLLYLVEDGLVLGVKSPTEWWIPDALPEDFG